MLNEKEKLEAVLDWTEKTLPLLSQLAKLKAVAGILLPAANVAGLNQALGTLNSLHSSISTNPNVINSLGRLAALYESGNDVAATETSNLIANRVAQGTEPSMAITETSFPDPETVVELPSEDTDIPKVKSLPPSDGDPRLGKWLLK